MITSIDNKHIKEIAKLLKKKYRDRKGMFLVEVFHLVEEARNANLLVEVFTNDGNTKGIFVSNEVIKKLSSIETTQPIVGLVKNLKYHLLAIKF